ncbi:hypothetical protein BDW02DRAFT_632389 [Decorospora gaudefroyi]|uniref:Uncharacterized protein n=1 Tax=Decorospora gaudefroyi TaxID=184978 RepID=A0A6A5K6J0_9PLEO|nr:hypothetical protein BDW02DRAFT_632389 [Decorospora gaudefroyi]
MAPGSNTPYNPADHGPPSTLLPEEMFGHVDVATLADIHGFLSESGLQEDNELGAWIKQNYLYGLKKDQQTATIRTPEGFAQLDRAYRRVRSLTNKAQDKWPFFDRNFKQMSTTTVRNNARGEAAPGVRYPNDGAQRSSSLTGPPQDPSDTYKDLSGPQLQVPFSSHKPSRYQAHKQEFPRSVRQTPAPLPPNLPPKPENGPDSGKQPMPMEQLVLKPSQTPAIAPELPKHTDFFSESAPQTMSLSEPPQSEHSSQSKAASRLLVLGTEPEVSQGVDGVVVPRSVDDAVSRGSSSGSSAEHDAKPVRDAGGGKVRGPNGRYLPKDNAKDNPSPGPKKTKKWNRRASKSRTNPTEKSGPATESAISEERQPESQPRSSTPAEDDNVFAGIQTPSPSTREEPMEDQNASKDETVSPPPDTTATPIANSDEAVSAEVEPTLMSLLAAEADPVRSNLDRLPPSSRKANKRKSEPTNQSGPRKRGKVGRPRKSEQGVNLEVSQEQLLPQMTTRRSTRRSVAAIAKESPENAAQVQAAPAPAKPAKEQQQSEVNKIDEDGDNIMSGVEEDATAGDEEVQASAAAPTSSSKLPAPSTTDSRLSSATPAPELPPPKVSDSELLDIGLSKTGSPSPRPLPHQSSYQSAPYQSPYQLPPPTADMGRNTKDASNTSDGTSITSAAQATQATASTQNTPATSTNDIEPTHPPGHVQYIARVTTAKGIVELPIASEHLDNDEEKMIRKYAEWNAQPGAVHIEYPQFRQIFAFAKES